MAASTEPNKLKIPGESTTTPSFASPQIQTAPDVRQSQAVAGNAPSVGNASPSVPSQTSEPKAKEVKVPTVTSQNAQATSASTPTSSVIPATSATATVPTATGAPPGVPATTPPVTVPPPTVGLAPTAKSIQGKNANEDEFLQAQNENAQKLYEAALQYNGGPTGELEKNQTKAEGNLRTATGNRGAAGTIESSLYGEDKNLIATALATGDTAAAVKYQESVNTANQLLNKAQIAFNQANEKEKREIAEQAEKREETEALEKASQQQAASPAPEGGGVVAKTSVQPGAGFVHVGEPQKKQRSGNGL